MAVFRVEKNSGYTVMSNHHLRNRALSLKAKGLLSQMLSLPEDWDYTLQGLARINRESIDAIRQAIRELEQTGYIQRSRERDEKGRLRGADYVIFELPQPVPASVSPTLENPTLENPTQENPTLENPMQLNKDKLITEKQKKEGLNASTELPVRLRRACLKLDKELDTRLYSIGIPAILNLALPSLLVTFLNSLLAAFSGSYVVVLGIYYKLQTFLYLPANGIVQGMRPLISYNYGAGEHKRVRRLYQITLILSAAIMAAGTLGCLVASEPLMRLFTSTPETVEAGKVALRIICLGFVVSAISTTSSGALEGLGKGTQSLVISLCRYIVFIMPLAWVLCRQFGPVGVWNAFWATEVLSAIVSLIVYKKSV